MELVDRIIKYYKKRDKPISFDLPGGLFLRIGPREDRVSPTTTLRIGNNNFNFYSYGKSGSITQCYLFLGMLKEGEIEYKDDSVIFSHKDLDDMSIQLQFEKEDSIDNIRDDYLMKIDEIILSREQFHESLIEGYNGVGKDLIRSNLDEVLAGANKDLIKSYNASEKNNLFMYNVFSFGSSKSRFKYYTKRLAMSHITFSYISDVLELESQILNEEKEYYLKGQDDDIIESLTDTSKFLEQMSSIAYNIATRTLRTYDNCVDVVNKMSISTPPSNKKSMDELKELMKLSLVSEDIRYEM